MALDPRMGAALLQRTLAEASWRPSIVRWRACGVTVTATLGANGTVYVWSETGTLNTSMATSSKKAVFTLTNPDIQPKLYYFTKANVFTKAAPVTVTPGQTYSIAVN